MKLLKIMFAFACLFLITEMNAQQSSFFIGANGGYNTSKFKFTEDLKELYPTSSPVLGFNGGFDMGIKLSNWTISTGIQYVQKGSEYQTDNFTDDGSVGYFTATEKAEYIAVPVTLGYNDYLAGRVGWSIAVGPSFNFGLSGKLDEVTEYFGTDDVEIQNYKTTFGSGVNEDYKAMQVGFRISPGLFIDLNQKSKLVFNVTWDLGTSDMFNPRYKDANDFFYDYKGDQLNRSAMFTVGYQYHFNFEDRY
jgi:hypothetical protein